MDRFGSNAGYVDALFEQFKKDPDSVNVAWREFFVGYQPQPDAIHTIELEPNSSPEPQVDTEPRSRITSDTPSTEDLTVTPSIVTRETLKSEQSDEAEVDPTIPLQGIAGRIVENMEQSLEVPTATTVRTIPVRLLEENRKIINEHQVAWARSKVSFTHLIAWALVKALRVHP